MLNQINYLIKYFGIKQGPRPDFKIGADSYWLYSKQNYSNENIEKERKLW